MKKLNRNAFNEKLLHRYLFERYYFANRLLRNKLLPERFHKYSINLISPEDGGSDSDYRADLKLYFKGMSEEVPVEVKWAGRSLTKKNQRDYLINKKGFAVAFSKPEQDADLIEHIVIDGEDFTIWVRENISKLARETLIYQANIENKSERQNWVVVLRGNAFGNFKKMLAAKSTNAFWAFRHNEKALKNIFDIQKNDNILFLFIKAGNSMSIPNNPDLEWSVSSWYLGEVVEPYYMELKGDKSKFFETEEFINKRKWPHFIDFKIKDHMDYGSTINMGKIGDYINPFCFSVNNGQGVPAPLIRRQMENLIDKLKSN